MQHDVIVIGGSYSGMAATLQLLRARRTVLVIDAGERRNRFARHAHGVLGHDGEPPDELAANARRQLEAYATLTWVEGRVDAVAGQVDDFIVTTTAGLSFRGRRVLLASGVTDRLPAVEGLAERWGRTVFHCPYCHGYELGQGRIGIVGASPMSIHQAELLTDWGDVTLLVNGAMDLDHEARSGLERRGVAIEDTPIDRIEGSADVVMADGRRLRFAGLFTATHTSPSGALAETMGCALEETPFGVQICVDAEARTSVAGVFACGDVARAPHSISLAIGGGALAGAQVHRSLLWPGTIASAQADSGVR
ncbi:NAD(P)/FAD-dependent oxidoreductase [Chiayiivirga flava]|uniref:Thioredoxin reductase n=1 Tax=Chiayiivirga flava TaxID=659595 RepID=A0A7W8FXQ8_9GAMM|nr:NAD(P)/FAD-dependent oxidoreductase [Chiayiivirga flava]MBB5206602.1 thioredoxin reductase [Chiayiivirga flava]